MRLLFTSTAYLPSIGGAQNYYHCLAKSLSHNHEIKVLCQWDKNRHDWLLGTTINAPTTTYDYEFEGMSVRRIGLSFKEKLQLAPYVPLYYPFMRFALNGITPVLANHISNVADNATLIHNVRIGREGISYASYQEARKRKIPFVLTPVHHPRWTGWRYKAYLDLYKMSDLVIVLTNAEKEILISLGVSEQRIAITGMGPVLAQSAEPAAFLHKNNITGPMVLFLGQHYEYKGFRQVLEASKLVWQKVPDAHFVFVGPAVGHSEQAFSHHQDRRILRLGNVSLQDKTNALAATDLLCVPSMQESFGGVYTEAWSFKKPVIGGNIPAIADVIDNGQNGFLVDQNPQEIAERIIHLLTNTAFAEAMGAQGYAKVNKKYTWSQIAQATETAYQSIL